MTRRILSALLCLILCFSLFTSAFAAEDNTDNADVYEEIQAASGEPQKETAADPVTTDTTDTGETSPASSAEEDIPQADSQEDAGEVLLESEEAAASDEFDLTQDGASRGSVISGCMTYIGANYGVSAVNTTYNHTYSGYVTREYSVYPYSLGSTRLAYCIDAACTAPSTSDYGYWYKWNTTASDTAAVYAASFLFSYYASNNSTSGQYWDAPLKGHSPSHLWNFAATAGLSNGSSWLATYWGTYGYFHEYITYAFDGNNNSAFDGASWLSGLWSLYSNYFNPSSSNFREDWYNDLLDYDIYIFVPTSTTTQRLITAVYNPQYKLSITKSSASPAITDGNDCYDLAGTTYTVYNTETDAENGTNAVGSLVCDSSGATNTLTLSGAGTYYIRETAAGKNYALDTEIHSVTVSSSGTTTVELQDTPSVDPFSLAIRKYGAGTTPYSTASTVFKIDFYGVSVEDICDDSGAITSEKLDSMMADSSVPHRTYYGSTKSSTSNTSIFRATSLLTNNTVTLNDGTVLTNDALYDPEYGMFPEGVFVITEIQAANGYNNDLSSNGTAIQSLIYTTTNNSTGDAYGWIVDTSGNVLKYSGTLTNTTELEDSIRPEISTNLTDSNGDSVILSSADAELVDTVHITNAYSYVDGTVDITLKLVDKNNNTVAEGSATAAITSVTQDVPVEFTFEGSSAVTGSYCAVVTATFTKTGVATATVTHNEDLSDGQETISVPRIGTTLTADDTSDHITGAGETISLTDTIAYEGLTPGKTYRVTGTLMNQSTGEAIEVNGKAVTAEKSFKPDTASGTVEIQFEFDGSLLAGTTVVAFETVYFRDKKVAVHADINDDDQSVLIPSIGTTLTADDTQDHITEADATVELTDVVAYDKLIPAKTYRLTGVLMDQSTGEPLLVNGEQVTAETTFTPENSSGTVSITFEFDASLLAGTTVVAFETLYYNDIEVAVHADITSVPQTLSFPKIGTTLTADNTGEHVTGADEKITLTDTVQYTGLIAGKRYVVEGVLMDKTTQEPLLVNGEQVTAKNTFTAENSNGSVAISFEFDGSLLAGTTIVAYETLSYKGTEVAVHANINDESQTTSIPRIGTTLTANDTEDHIAGNVENLVLTDEIAYENLVPGLEYRVEGTLMVKTEDGCEPLTVNGKEITSDPISFTPDKKDGTVSATFSFDASALDGKALVAYEYLYIGGKLIASHEVPDSEDQTVYIPELHTTATDSETHNHTSYADTEVTITDSVQYSNLITDGREYTVAGVLVNKETGEMIEVAGEPVTAGTKFVPEESSGSVDVVFTFDGSLLAGTTTVAFEALYYKGIEVGFHMSIDDEAQTVVFPKIGTQARDKSDKDNSVARNSTVTVVDTLSYEGLTAGSTYVAEAFLMDAKGNVVTSSSKEVTGTTEFTPEKADGKTEVELTFNTSGLSGDAAYTVFEYVYEIIPAETDGSPAEDTDEGDTEAATEKVLIASHTDLSDTDQQIKLDTPVTNVKTDDMTNVWPYIILALLCMTGIGAAILIKKRFFASK